METKAGYMKIRAACGLTRAAGWNYVWVDTNCIDKSSSAELSEAINSMFQVRACPRLAKESADSTRVVPVR